MITVIQNAYLKKIQNCETYSEKHKHILFLLMNEKKYFEKGELLSLTQNNQKELDDILEELAQVGTIILEGWLVRLKPIEEFEQFFLKEIIN